MRRVVAALVTVLLTQVGCSRYSLDAALRDALRGDPRLAPTCTSMTPALTCLRQHILARRSHLKTHGLSICVADPGGEGFSSHRAGALISHALMALHVPGFLEIQSCRSIHQVGPLPAPDPVFAPALTSSVVIEHDVIDASRDGGAGVSTYGKRTAALLRLGLSESETISRMGIILQPQGERGVLQDSVSVAVDYVESRDATADLGIGGTIAAFQAEVSGTVSLVRVTSRDQIMQYLFEQAVVLYISRALNITTPCLQLTAATPAWRDLFDLLTAADKRHLEGTLLRRMAAARLRGSSAVIADGELIECELSWGLAAGFLTKKDLATLKQLPPRLLATVPERHRGS